MLLSNLQFAYKELLAEHHPQVQYRNLTLDKKKFFNHNKKDQLLNNLIISNNEYQNSISEMFS